MWWASWLLIHIYSGTAALHPQYCYICARSLLNMTYMLQVLMPKYNCRTSAWCRLGESELNNYSTVCPQPDFPIEDFKIKTPHPTLLTFDVRAACSVFFWTFCWIIIFLVQTLLDPVIWRIWKSFGLHNQVLVFSLIEKWDPNTKYT